MLSGASRSHAYRLVALAALLAVIGAYLIALAARKPIDHDEHQFVASAALLAREGLLPYKDYPYHHLPYLTFAYAGVFLLTDRLLLGARCLSVAFALAGLLLTFALVREAFRDVSAALRDALAAAFTIVLAVNPLFLYATSRAWNHDASVLLALVAFVSMIRASRDPRTARWLFFSGVALGASIGVRSSFALLAPGFALGVLMMPHPSRSPRTVIAGVAALAAGTAAALVPLLPLFAAAPEGFLHGNLRYNLELNTAYREALGHGVAMSLGGKLDYFVGDVLSLRRNSFLLLTYLTCWACLVGRRSRRHAFEQRLVLALLPFLTLAALSATPSWYQYFYPLVPFAVVGIASAAADYEAMRLRPLAGLAIGVLLLGSILGLRHYTYAFTPTKGGGLLVQKVHEMGSRVAELAGDGPVLTLAPILPLEGGAKIYPELATGPFAWRTTPMIPPGERARLRAVGPAELEELVTRSAPTAILVGGEAEAGERPEDPLIRYAIEHHYRPEPLALNFVLWVAPTNRAAGES